MNRRSFLSLIGSIPGVSYFVKADQGIGPVTEVPPVSLSQPIRTHAPVIPAFECINEPGSAWWTPQPFTLKPGMFVRGPDGVWYQVGETGTLSDAEDRNRQPNTRLGESSAPSESTARGLSVIDG